MEEGEKMKIYISGKITGEENYMEKFQEVEERLIAEGYKVFNPASINSMMPDGTTYEEYMKVSFCLIDIADAVYMMSGWELSKGAIRELHYANAMGKKAYFEDAGGVTDDN